MHFLDRKCLLLIVWHAALSPLAVGTQYRVEISAKAEITHHKATADGLSLIQHKVVGSGCAEAVLTGLDNLLGVCSAKADIADATRFIRGDSKEDFLKRINKVRGPGGNLITQDITEDVRLGPTTKKDTRYWHKAFTACAAEGNLCAAAVQLHEPVLLSVQAGIQSLISSPKCKQAGMGDIQLKFSDFVTCGKAKIGKDGLPNTSDKLTSLVQRVRAQLPASFLAKYPLHDVVAWAEPSFKLPK